MLETRPVRDHDDVARHFDSIASSYQETHGPARELLDDRLAIIRRMYRGLARPGARLLEIGCGPAAHLVELAPDFAGAAGVDVSPGMIEVARARVARRGARDIELRVDVAEELATVADGSMGVVLCVGALEHMLDRARVFVQVARVLEPGGVFVCLTHNGDSIWYAHIAPALGIATKHLSADRSLRAREIRALAAAARLDMARLEPWTFIARGDMPWPWPRVLACLDRVGRATGIAALRGGLAFAAVKRRDPCHDPS